MKKLYAFLFLAFSLVSFIAYSFMPVHLSDKTVEIPYGTPTLRIVEILREEGIIRSILPFVVLHTIMKSKLEAGEYEFDGYVSVFDVYKKLSKGIHKLHRIVVREGSDLYDIADILERKGICSREDFLRYALSEEVAKSFGINSPTMEGFLFPETYFFSKNTHPLKVIRKMHQTFLEKTRDLREELKEQNELSLEEWVIIASMIEKETYLESEKPIISAVIRNRLKKRMRLQIDPTVIYALKRNGLWRGALTKEDMGVDDPFNTYLYFGLPPTPICNPGLSSLRAALHPARVRYLYFVVDPDRRRHIFSVTYNQHLRNVARLRRKR